MNIETREVQEIRFYLHSATHDYAEEDCSAWKMPVDYSMISVALEEWACQFYGQYRRQTIGFETIGKPYHQERYIFDLEEIRNFLGLVNTEKIEDISFYPGFDTQVTFVVRIHENPES